MAEQIAFSTQPEPMASTGATDEDEIKARARRQPL